MVTWTRPLVALPRGRSSVTNGTLTIQDFSAVDTGTYVCTAENKLGSVNAVMALNIQRKPGIHYNNGFVKFNPLNGWASTSLWGWFLSEIVTVLVFSEGRCSLKHCSLVAKFVKESQSLHTN